MRKNIRNTILAGLTGVLLSGCDTVFPPARQRAPHNPQQQTFVDAIFAPAEAVLGGKMFGGGQQTVIVQQAQQVQQHTQSPGWTHNYNVIFGNVHLATGSNFIDINRNNAVDPGELQNVSNTFPLTGKFDLACKLDYGAKNINLYICNTNGTLEATLPVGHKDKSIGSFIMPISYSYTSPKQVTLVLKGHLSNSRINPPFERSATGKDFERTGVGQDNEIFIGAVNVYISDK